MKKDNQNQHSHTFTILLIIALVMLAITFCVTFYSKTNQSRLSGNSGRNLLIPLEDQWEQAKESQGDTSFYQYDIPKEDNLMLSFTASTPMDLFLDEELIFHFENPEKSTCGLPILLSCQQTAPEKG